MSPGGGTRSAPAVAARRRSRPAAAGAAPAASRAAAAAGACVRQALELDEADRLRLAVLGDDEVLRGQSLDRLAVLVLDADRLHDQPRRAAEGRRRRLLRGCCASAITPTNDARDTIRRRSTSSQRRSESLRDLRDLSGSLSISSRISASSCSALSASYSHRQPELRAADDRVHARVGHAVEHVRRVDAASRGSAAR